MTNIPLTGNFKVTCEYKRKGNWKAGFHTGIDLVSNNLQIFGTCNGKVVRRGFDNSYGNFVVVKSSDDETFHWYCHLDKIFVKIGLHVSRGTYIGIMGNTGNSTGRHLHFEIRDKSNEYGKVLNPAYYMGIENKVGSYNSINYDLVEISKNLEKSEFKIKVTKTGAENENCSMVSYFDPVDKKEIQFWALKSNIKRNVLTFVGSIAVNQNNNKIVAYYDPIDQKEIQFWI